MTGKQKPEIRKSLWHQKRVFFCTPQIFEKDLLQGKEEEIFTVSNTSLYRRHVSYGVCLRGG